MTARDALAAWVAATLGVAVSTEPLGMEPSAPTAIVLFDTVMPSEGLRDGLIERYTVALAAPVVGASVEDKVTALAEMERTLLTAANDFRRADAAWDHMAAQRLDGYDGASAWQVDVWTL